MLLFGAILIWLMSFEELFSLNFYTELTYRLLVILDCLFYFGNTGWALIIYFAFLLEDKSLDVKYFLFLTIFLVFTWCFDYFAFCICFDFSFVFFSYFFDIFFFFEGNYFLKAVDLRDLAGPFFFIFFHTQDYPSHDFEEI